MPRQTFRSIYQRLLFVFFLVVAFLFAACSSAPSESEGKKFLDDKGAEAKLYTVKSFTKTNGIEDDRTYTMEYKAELECLRPGGMVIGPGKTSATDLGITCQNKGQVGDVEGRLVFEKTENGWRVKP